MNEHNHQAGDGPDYEGCPACIVHHGERAVQAAAAEVYKPEGVDIWMNAPNPTLNNATPMQFIRAGDTDRVLAVLAGLADGVMG